MRPAAAVLLLLFLLPACPSSEDEPEDVVSEFIEAMNRKEWDEMLTHLSQASRDLLPEDDGEVALMRARLFAVLDSAGGRVEHQEEEALDRGDGEVQVRCTLTVRSLAGSIVKMVTFRLHHEAGAWKLLPQVEMEGGHVVDDPVRLFRNLTRLRKPGTSDDR